MSGTNDFQPLAGAAGANVLTQAQYLALSTLLADGFSSGILASNQLNKVLRQATIMSAVVGQLIADATGQNATDDGTTATLEANLARAIRGDVWQGADTGAANAYAMALAPPPAAITPGMLVGIRGIVAGNTGASTFNLSGLGALQIQGPGAAAMQGGEFVTGGSAILQANAGATAWNLIWTSGAQPVAVASQSGQAVNLGQFLGPMTTGCGLGSVAANTVYTKTLSFTAPSAGFVWGQARTAFGSSAAAGVTVALLINGTSYQLDQTVLPMTDAGVAQVAKGASVTVTAQLTTGTTAPGTAMSLYADAIFIPSLTN